MDLRKEMDLLLKDYGFPVLLQRTSRKLRCRCWDERYQEAQSRCPLCNGAGWVIRIERVTVRKQDASMVVSKPNRDEQSAIGSIWTSASVFYMSYLISPRVGDIIYEVGWDGARPMNLVEAHEISHVETHRGDDGRIEYYRVATKLTSTDRQFREAVVRRIGARDVNYELVF